MVNECLKSLQINIEVYPEKIAAVVKVDEKVAAEASIYNLKGVFEFFVMVAKEAVKEEPPYEGDFYSPPEGSAESVKNTDVN